MTSVEDRVGLYQERHESFGVSSQCTTGANMEKELMGQRQLIQVYQENGHYNDVSVCLSVSQ